MTNVHSLYGNLAVAHDAPSEEICTVDSAITEAVPQAVPPPLPWKDNSAAQQAGAPANTPTARRAGLLLAGVAVAALAFYWLYWKDNQSAQAPGGAAIYGTIQAADPASGEAVDSKAKTGSQARTESAAMKAFVAGTNQSVDLAIPKATTAEQAAPAAAAAAAASSASAKAGEFERLTAMLKGMGLGTHKLDASATAANTKASSTPDKATELAKAAEAAKAGSASSAQAAKAVALPDTSRSREEVARQAAPDPVPARSETKTVADAGRVGSAPAASASAASAGNAPRAAVVVDARNCALPKYPINAYLNGDSGTVLLALLVASDGRVLESKVQKSSGFSELDKAARKALSLCKFKPADGQAEPAWATLTYVWNRD